MFKQFKLSKSGGLYSGDARYFELKYQINLYIIIASLLFAFISFLGYDKYHNISDLIDTSVSSKIEKYSQKVDTLDKKADSIDNFVKHFNNEKEALNAVLLKTGKSAKDIENNINILASKRFNSQNIYIIKNYKIHYADDDFTFHYRPLTTYDGKKLPKFTKPPYINILTNSELKFQIWDVTEDYFKVIFSSTPNTRSELEKRGYISIDILIISDE
jgi:hypothetical protein